MYYDYIKELQITQGTNNKLDVLSVALKDETFEKYMRYLLNPFFQAWIAEIDWSIQGNGSIKPGDAIHELIEFLEYNDSRSEDAVSTVESIIGRAHPDEVDALKYFIKRDIRAGVAAKLVNKAKPGTVPTFELMLAKQWKNGKIKYPCYVEPKLDGLRGISLVDAHEIEYKTRSGKSLGDHVEFDAELRRLLPSPLSAAVDGEVMSRDFQALMRQARRKHDGDMEGMYYAVFDMMTMGEWRSQNCERNYLERRRVLAKRFDAIGAEKDEQGFRWLDRMCLVPVKKVKNEEALIKIYQSWFDKGFEGIIVKMDGPYEFKRSKYWVKKKPVAEFDGVIVDVEQGTDGKQFADVLGAFMVEIDGVVTRVGGGFSVQDREEYWKHREEMIGRKVEVEGDPRLTDDGCVRWPIFRRFRDDLED